MNMNFRCLTLCLASLLTVTHASRNQLTNRLRASSFKINTTSIEVDHAKPSDSSTSGQTSDVDRSHAWHEQSQWASGLLDNLTTIVKAVAEVEGSKFEQIMRLLHFKKDEKLKHNQARLAHLQNGDGGDVEGVFLPLNTLRQAGQPISPHANLVYVRNRSFGSDFDPIASNGTHANATKDTYFLDPIFEALEGTGARAGSTGNSNLDRALIRRMASQDMAVLLMLLVIYVVTLIVGWSIVYRMSQNMLPVKFYSDRYHMLTLGEEAANTVDGFMHTFISAPKGIRLQVTGFKQSEEGEYWRGHHYVPEFCFSLDLSPWIKFTEGFPGSERQNIHDFLRSRNVLQQAEIHMDVDWDDWEELAINIKQQIRSTGFQGPLDVHFARKDKVMVFQNAPWANFMNSQTTRALCVLSVVGILLYIPYMWIRCTKAEIKSKFKVDISIQQYWNLISDKLTAQDFLGGDAAYLGAR